jgi:hypothetical protein
MLPGGSFFMIELNALPGEIARGSTGHAFSWFGNRGVRLRNPREFIGRKNVFKDPAQF